MQCFTAIKAFPVNLTNTIGITKPGTVSSVATLSVKEATNIESSLWTLSTLKSLCFEYIVENIVAIEKVVHCQLSLFILSDVFKTRLLQMKCV